MFMTELQKDNLMSHIWDNAWLSEDWNEIVAVDVNPEDKTYLVTLSHDSTGATTQIVVSLNWYASWEPYPTLLEIPFCNSDFPIEVYRAT